MVTATGSIRASGAHAATTPTRPKTIRPQPDAHEASPCSRAFSAASLMHLCSGKRCNLAPALTQAVLPAVNGMATADPVVDKLVVAMAGAGHSVAAMSLYLGFKECEVRERVAALYLP